MSAAWIIIWVLGLVAAFCIGRAWDRPNLKSWDLNRIYGEDRRW